MEGRIKYNVMSEDELALFIKSMERLLIERGIKLDHPALINELKENGCIVDGGNVKFPKEVIDRAVKAVPAEFTYYAPDAQFDMKFPHPEGSFYTRTCTGAPYYMPVEGEKHPATLEDLREWYTLTNELENIDFVALPSACGDEAELGESIDVAMLRVAFEISKKHIWVQPYNAESTLALIELCKEFHGGAEKLRNHPVVSFISCSVPVLKFKYMDSEIIYQCAKHGIPVQPCALPTAGANTPVTASGTALAACADVLAQIVMLELLCPGLPVIATPLLFSMDMQTTHTLQSNTEITFARLICMQAFEQGYNIRCHSYGSGSDSFYLDDQNAIERTSLIHMMAMSDASVLGGAGQLETAKTISPLALIGDNENFGIAKRLRRGLKIDEEALDIEELLEGNDENGYLMSDHTMEHFSEAHRPELFFKGKVSGQRDEEKTMATRMKEKYYSIMEKAKNNEA